MSGIVTAIAGVVWLVAVWAVVSMARALFALSRLAPAGRGFDTLRAMMALNYPAVSIPLGPAAAPHIERFRKGVRLFTLCFGLFMLLVVITIVMGVAGNIRAA